MVQMYVDSDSWNAFIYVGMVYIRPEYWSILAASDDCQNHSEECRQIA